MYLILEAKHYYYYYRVEIDWIVRKISGNPSLFGVSKIFIFDCCRGRKVSIKKIFTKWIFKRNISGRWRHFPAMGVWRWCS